MTGHPTFYTKIKTFAPPKFRNWGFFIPLWVENRTLLAVEWLLEGKI